MKVSAAKLVRLSRLHATEPYWSRGVYRFDCPDVTSPSAFGTCYAGGSLEVAFAESIIHESSWFVSGHFEVPLAELTARRKVYFHRPRRQTLLLADLTGTALKALGLNNDISSTDDYTAPQAWAQAIHDADPRWDGIRYVSRQKNDGFAFAVFERSKMRRRSSEDMTAQELDLLCDAFGVAAT